MCGLRKYFLACADFKLPKLSSGVLIYVEDSTADLALHTINEPTTEAFSA
jgi:hypothetical protein